MVKIVMRWVPVGHNDSKYDLEGNPKVKLDIDHLYKNPNEDNKEKY